MKGITWLAGGVLVLSALALPGCQAVKDTVESRLYGVPQLKDGASRSGELRAGDVTLRSGEFMDEFGLKVSAGDAYRIRMTSTEFDPYLLIRLDADPSFELDNDDGLDMGKDSEIWVVFERAGRYRVVATSYEPGESGAYQLEVEEVTAEQVAEHHALIEERSSEGNTPIALGQPTTGRLEAGDATLDSGEFIDWYTYQATPGETVRVRMSSSEFDTYLLVTHAGDQQDNDDAAGQGTNSEVVITSANGGGITIGATSFASGESGSYQLQLDRP